MTQEQKARAYDGALKRAKEIKSKILSSHLSTESCKVVSEYIDTIIPELAESEDERIRKEIIKFIQDFCNPCDSDCDKWIAYLEKQKEASKAIEAVERIDKYIDEHVENAHDMKDSNPDKKYCQGIDDTLAGIAGILQDVYSNEKQKESLRDFIDNFPYSAEQEEQKHPNGCFTCDEYKKGYEAGRLNGFTAGYNKAMKEQKLDSLTKYVYSKDDKKFIQDCANILVANDYSATAERLLSMFEQKPVDYEAELKKCKDNPLYFFDKYVSIKQKPANDKAFEEWIDDWWKHNKVNNPDSYDNGDEIQFDEKNFKNFCRGIKNMYQQKPAEWSEEDKSFYNSIICEVIKEGMHPTPEQAKWFKSIPERFSLQQKVEWSEEDERIRNQLIYDVEHHKKEGLISAKQNKATKALYNGIEECYDEKIAWLKSLPERFNLQPKQEWSEEDETMRNLAIEWAETMSSQFSFVDMDSTDFRKIITWLKSLRPQYHGDVTMTEAYKMGKEAGEASHWKPTEHQMTILKAVKEYVGKGSGYWGEELGALIDDLEKL